MEEHRIFTQTVTRAAREVAERTEKKKKGKGEGGREEARARVGKWNRIEAQARRWNGKLTRTGGWEGTTFARIEQIARDEGVKDAVQRGTGVKEAVQQVCRQELEKATAWFEGTDAHAAERMITEMEEAVTEDAGGAMIRIFTALRNATAGGGKSDSRLTAVRMPRAADGTRWRRMKDDEKGGKGERER